MNTHIDSDRLVSAYVSTAVPLDRLPYSPELDRIAAAQAGGAVTDSLRKEIWLALLDLRKRGRLPRLRR